MHSTDRSEKSFGRVLPSGSILAPTRFLLDATATDGRALGEMYCTSYRI